MRPSLFFNRMKHAGTFFAGGLVTMFFITKLQLSAAKNPALIAESDYFKSVLGVKEEHSQH
ncbi:hypothetical protein H696_03621 [Fonticula alba]|uniref:Uncharacterized protein n=1 Tax=Fonticula alba TaxID=691883 RepID=A0A058Z9G6_FONAL|nr:hypothetical protein H696_03621 [Fonticula alba]KCV70162.1 hypothetical protein H696_03621 [Fonticula alba]|eukprot:XP_009495768.1 hypothetical protein H696_03621 [Fonticula alba]